MILKGDPYAIEYPYYDRSPIRFAQQSCTPLLRIVGCDDRVTPPTQALHFHRALVEHGRVSTIATYPGEGHGIRQFPAYIDYFS